MKKLLTLKLDPDDRARLDLIADEQGTTMTDAVRQMIRERATSRLARVEFLRERDGNDCQMCGKPLTDPIHVDHIIPVSRGGEKHDLDNMQLTHARCNRLKGQRLPSELSVPLATKRKTTILLEEETRCRLQAIAALRGCSWSVVVDELAEIAAEALEKGSDR